MNVLRRIYQPGQFGLSVEIFPPKTADGEADLESTLRDLSRFRPAFISCTYGAGGSTRDRTLHWCRFVLDELGLPATAHFTCVGSSREELGNWLGEANQAGIPSIMALRGDPPKGETAFRPAEDGLCNANELVAFIRERLPEIGIGVAGYPETHLEAESAEKDLDYLIRKVRAGADAVFTQMFFSNDHFYRFRDTALAAGLDIPLVPGIMPITSFDRIQRISQMCGTQFPLELASRLEDAKGDSKGQYEIGLEHAIAQCEELRASGVPGMHFYALNKAQACQRIFNALGFAEEAVEVS